jgi:6-phosphogluconolactonase (cycloisomerase 2 family)
MMSKKSWLSLGLAFILCLSLFAVGCGGGGGGKKGNGGNTGDGNIGGTLGFAYVRSIENNKIYSFSIDSVTGVLTAIPEGEVTINQGQSIGKMAADPSGKFLYVAKGSQDSSSDVYKMLIYEIDSDTGRLNSFQGLDMEGTHQPQIVAVDPTGKYVAVTHTYDGITVIFKDRIGKLTTFNKYKDILDISPDSERFEPMDITFDRTGAYLFVAGDELDSSYNWKGSVIHVYKKFVEVAGSPFETFGRPGSIAIGPDGKFLYVVANGQVRYHEIGSAEGVLGPDTKAADISYQAMTFTISGNFLYLAYTTSKTIDVYSINADGSLTKKTGPGFSVSLDATSEMLMVDPTGRYLYTNESMKDVIRGFSINPDGSLTEIPGSPWDLGERVKAIVIAGKK